MIDLHLHLDGSMRPETVRELLEQKGISPWDSDDDAARALRVGDDCADLNDYLTKFEYPCMVLQTSGAIERAVYELAEDLVHQDVTYAEIRFAPQLSTKEGLTQEEAVKAAIEGAKEAEMEFDDIRIGLILCCMRGEDHEANIETVRVASKYYGNYVCALDLAGAEALYPTDLFNKEFELAKAEEIPFTIHAGEAAGPESIWRALEFGASRIGHGIRCLEDGALVDYLARHKIPLEICLTSNIQTKVYQNYDEYPVKELLLRGVHVTVNTDNMTVSGTNLKKERKKLLKYCDITKDDIALMEEYSYEARFLQSR